MTKSVAAIMGAVALTAVLGGAYLSMGPKSDSVATESATEKEAMMKKEPATEEAMMKKDAEVQMTEAEKMAQEKMAMEKEAMMKKDPATEEAMMKKEPATEVAGDTMMKKEPSSETAMMPAKGVYVDYDPSKLANATEGPVVLFFHAPWCPTCKKANTNFMEGSIPDGLTLLKTDYDSSTAMKQKYGVTYQHTFVQVDKDGNLIKKWSGSSTYDALTSQLK